MTCKPLTTITHDEGDALVVSRAGDQGVLLRRRFAHVSGPVEFVQTDELPDLIAGLIKGYRELAPPKFRYSITYTNGMTTFAYLTKKEAESSARRMVEQHGWVVVEIKEHEADVTPCEYCGWEK